MTNFNNILIFCCLTEVKPCFTYLRNLTYFSVQSVSQLVKKVKIVEVGPRDGLQNEKVYIKNALVTGPSREGWSYSLGLTPILWGGVYWPKKKSVVRTKNSLSCDLALKSVLYQVS